MNREARLTAQRHLTWVAGVATLCTALSLTPLFESRAWLVQAAVTVVLVAVIGLGGRTVGLPAAAVVGAQVVGAAVLLTYQFGAGHTRWWGLPTWRTVEGMARVGENGLAQMEQSAAPLEASPGVALLTLMGIAAVAVAVDLLAVSLRLVPLAGLPLLALYTVPVSVAPGGVPWTLFVLAALSFVGLLLAEGRDRLSGWGRPIGFTERDTAAHLFVDDVQTRPIARAGRRMGAAAVCLAVAVPVAVPVLDGFQFGGNAGSLGGGGGGVRSSTDPFLDLVRDLTRDGEVTLFTYTTDDPSPDYFRTTTLEEFDGEQWRRADRPLPDRIVAGPLPVAPGIGAVLSQTRTTQVTISDQFDPQWLPLPYPATQIRADDGRWAYDPETLNVLGLDSGSAGTRYEVTSLDLDYDAAPTTGTAPDGLDAYLELPDLPGLVTTTAEAVTAGAGSPLERAVALQEWFRDPAEFAYSLDVVPGHGGQALVDFLTDRSGYCEQFAATMAVMARHLGVPARVSVGFMPGDRNSDQTWEVTSYDAHAWPELFIDGLGWTRFEPTPQAQTGAAPAWTRPEQDPATAPTVTAPAGVPSAAPPDRPGLEGGTPTAAPEGFRVPWTPILAATGALLVLAVPLLLRVAMTRRRWSRARTPAEHADAAWALLQDTAADLGHTSSRFDTPRTLGRRLLLAIGADDAGRDALQRLVAATERARFARDTGQTGDVRADLGAVTTALQGNATRAARLRARYLPRSTARVFHAISERAGDGLDRLDGLGASVRSALHRRPDLRLR